MRRNWYSLCGWRPTFPNVTTAERKSTTKWTEEEEEVGKNIKRIITISTCWSNNIHKWINNVIKPIKAKNTHFTRLVKTKRNWRFFIEFTIYFCEVIFSKSALKWAYSNYPGESPYLTFVWATKQFLFFTAWYFALMWKCSHCLQHIRQIEIFMSKRFLHIHTPTYTPTYTPTHTRAQHKRYTE